MREKKMYIVALGCGSKVTMMVTLVANSRLEAGQEAASRASGKDLRVLSIEAVHDRKRANEVTS